MKHYAIFEVNHNTTKTTLIDTYENQEEWENIKEYNPWITGITVTNL